MKIYTKTGDAGTTALFGGSRVPKYHLRIESYGTVDELNAVVGLIRSQAIDSDSKEALITIQNHLFAIGATLATDPERAILKNGKERLRIEKVNENNILFLEEAIDRMNDDLPPITSFVLPGGNNEVSFCHMARTICRRAERRVTELNFREAVDPYVIKYLNRLSDYFFVLARKLTHDMEVEEIPWLPEKSE